MSAYDSMIAERRRQRRIARRIEAAVILIILAAALVVFFAYHPERANAGTYNHLAACQASLRGSYSDDDVHLYGVRTGAKSFGGWGSGGHYSDGSAYVWAYFNYSYGYTVLVKGRCSGGDYAADWFSA